MFSKDFLGTHLADLEYLINTNASLNSKVEEQVNQSQELCMLRAFDQEASEYRLQKSLQARVFELACWRWVLEDLLKRLDDAYQALEHERNALKVVIQRIENEISVHSQNASRPGALNPFTDEVEDSIMQEYKFLQKQKTNFQVIASELDKDMKCLRGTKQRIENDLMKKESAIAVDEECMNKCCKKPDRVKKKKCCPINQWEKRCECLKSAGLRALSDALVIREQWLMASETGQFESSQRKSLPLLADGIYEAIPNEWPVLLSYMQMEKPQSEIRYTRVNLSLAAQAKASRVDTALRRRLHTNEVKLEELKWQKDEAHRDLESLQNELSTTEQTLLDIINKIVIIESRLSNRKRRPPGEMTLDHVNRKLKEELGKLKRATRELNDNISNIKSLKRNVNKSILEMDCCSNDLMEVINLDRSRIQSRLSDSDERTDSCDVMKVVVKKKENDKNGKKIEQLTVIKEETEDDYPFDF